MNKIFDSVSKFFKLARNFFVALMTGYNALAEKEAAEQAAIAQAAQEAADFAAKEAAKLRQLELDAARNEASIHAHETTLEAVRHFFDIDTVVQKEFARLSDELAVVEDELNKLNDHKEFLEQGITAATNILG